MQRTANGQTQTHGGDTSAPASRAARIASRGVRTGRDLANLSSALITDALNGAVGIKEGNLAARGGALLIRTAEHNARHGAATVIAEDPTGEGVIAESDPLAKEEADLEARLEAVRRCRHRGAA